MPESRYRDDLHAHFCEACDGCFPCQSAFSGSVCASGTPCPECGATPDASRVIAVRTADA